MTIVSSVLSSALSLAGLPRSMALYSAAFVAVAARRIAMAIVQYMAIGIVFAIGLAFLTAAGFLALMHELGSVYASLIVGGAYVLLGLVAFLVMRARR